MIQYNEGRWSILFACHMYGSVMDRALALAFPCGLLAFGLHHAVRRFPALAVQLEEDMSEASVHQGFTFVLGFLIVFRCQQAYSRWWEAGTLLQQLRGDWFNAFSNMVSFFNDDTDPAMAKKVEELKHRMVRLFSLLYGSALRQVSSKQITELQFINFAGLEPESIEFLERSNDTCEVVLQWIQRVIVKAHNDNVIKIAPPILTRVYNQLGQGIVKLNNARKINEFLVPYCLAQFIAVMLILHWFWTVIICAVMISSAWIAGGAAFVICFAFWGVNYIAVELENPYGDDPNDLPICEMQTDMNQSLESLMQPLAAKPPEFDYVKSRDDLTWEEPPGSPRSDMGDSCIEPKEESRVSVLLVTDNQKNLESERYIMVKFTSAPHATRFLSRAQKEKWRASPVDPLIVNSARDLASSRAVSTASQVFSTASDCMAPMTTAHLRARGELDDSVSVEPDLSPGSPRGPRAEARQQGEEEKAQVQEAEHEEDGAPLTPSSDGVALALASRAGAQARDAPLRFPSGDAAPGASNVGAASAADRPSQGPSRGSVNSYEMSEDSSLRGGSKPRYANEHGESAAPTGLTSTSELE